MDRKINVIYFKGQERDTVWELRQSIGYINKYRISLKEGRLKLTTPTCKRNATHLLARFFSIDKFLKFMFD